MKSNVKTILHTSAALSKPTDELLVYQTINKSSPHFPHQNKLVLSLTRLKEQSFESDSRKIANITKVF